MSFIWSILCLLVGTPLIAQETIVIGSKNFTEQVILGEIIAQIIEADLPEINVDRRLNLGGTHINFEALKSGQIDLYPEYTGTAKMNILNQRNSDTNFKDINRQFKNKFGLVWLSPLGFSNTYALAVREGDGSFKNVFTISKLADLSNRVHLGTIQEFISRADGLIKLEDVYNFHIPPSKITALDPGLMYLAIKENQVNVITAFSTDGRIDAFNLRLLKDNKKAFPIYEAAIVVRQETLRKIPKLKEVLEELSGRISSESMREMNYQVDFKGRLPREVALEFLVQEGVVPDQIIQRKATANESFFLYLWSHREYVYRLLKQHLYLSGTALFFASLVGVTLGVLLTLNESLNGLVFMMVNTFQTIPSPALLGFMVPLFGIGVIPAIIALFLYSLLPLVRNTYVGIKEIDQTLIEASTGIGLTQFQILRKVQIPLALPMILAGLRTSTVIVVGTATLASLIGAGGLGDPIFRGISSVNTNLILLGAVPAALLAIFLDKLLQFAEYVVVSKGLRLQKN